MAEEESVTFSITLPAKVHEKVLQQAENLGLNRSAFIRHITLMYLEDKKEPEDK